MTATTVAPSAAGTTFARPGRDHVPGLDGLRGVAVIAVMLFHHFHFSDGGRHAWSGGFLGVDIFFVLSGYLITALLLDEHGRTGSIAFGSFWARRARRLLPALFVVVAVVGLCAPLLLHRNDLPSLRTDAWFTLGYLQNWHHRVPGSLLGHTWSLAVEEQWYLVWPLVVAAGLRFRRSITGIVVGGIVASCALTWWLAATYGTERAYNGTDARAQQLLVGAFVAVLLATPRALNARMRRRLDAAAAVAAVGFAVAFSTATTTDAWYYRGGMLVVAIGAAVVTTAVSAPGSISGRVLSWTPLRVVGTISYGLYLIHIPVYAWATPYRTGWSGAALLVARLAATTALAGVSFVVVERPIRRSALGGVRLVAALLLGATLSASCVAIGTANGGPIPGIAPATAHALATIAVDTPAGTRRVLVFGDSAAFALAQHTPGGHRGASIRGAAVGRLGCGVLDGLPLFGDAAVPTPADCTDSSSLLRGAVEAFDPDVVVLVVGSNELSDRLVGTTALRRGTDAHDERIVRRLATMAKIVRDADARVVVATPGCLERSGAAPAWVDHLRTTVLDWARARRLTTADWHRALCDGTDAATAWTRAGLSADGTRRTWAWLSSVVG